MNEHIDSLEAAHNEMFAFHEWDAERFWEQNVKISRRMVRISIYFDEFIHSFSLNQICRRLRFCFGEAVLYSSDSALKNIIHIFLFINSCYIREMFSLRMAWNTCFDYICINCSFVQSAYLIHELGKETLYQPQYWHHISVRVKPAM